LFQVARRFNMEVQPQLVLLQKTLLAIEGLGRQIYPDLDLWETAKPFLEKWVKEQIGPKAFIHQLKQNLPFFTEQLPHLPRLVYDVLELKKLQLTAQQIAAAMQIEQINEPRKRSSDMALGATFVFLLGSLAYLSDWMPDERFGLFALGGFACTAVFLIIQRIVRF